MKLYYAPGACSLSPHIALQESGLAFTLERVDLKAHRTERDTDYYTINPKGYVPALELDDGALITEGPAILQYVADRAPEANLAPAAGSFERVRLQEWLNFLSTEVHKGFSPLWNSSAPAETRQAAQDKLFGRLDWLDGELRGRDHLMGAFGVADGYLFTLLNWCNFLKIGLDRWPALQRYAARVAARPAVLAALRAEGLA